MPVGQPSIWAARDPGNHDPAEDAGNRFRLPRNSDRFKCGAGRPALCLWARPELPVDWATDHGRSRPKTIVADLGSQSGPVPPHRHRGLATKAGPPRAPPRGGPD